MLQSFSKMFDFVVRLLNPQNNIQLSEAVGQIFRCMAAKLQKRIANSNDIDHPIQAVAVLTLRGRFLWIS